MSGPVDSPSPNMQASVLAGTTWLIVADDLSWADGVARALRMLGACVHLLDTQGKGVARLMDADAQVLLLSAGAPSHALHRALDGHPGLRLGAPVVLHPDQVWPTERAAPDIDALMRLCGPALQADRSARAKATRGEQISVELHDIGLPRLLRALADVRGSYVVQLSPGDADAHVALSDGQWIGASYWPKARNGERVDGAAALRRALSLREAACLVLPASKLHVPSWKQPLDSALAHALTALNAERDAALQDEPTRPSYDSQKMAAAGTANTIGPPKERQAAMTARDRNRAPLLAAAGLAGFAIAGLLMLWLDGGAPAPTGGSVRERTASAATQDGAAGLHALRVEPLTDDARAVRAPQAEGASQEADQPMPHELEMIAARREDARSAAPDDAQTTDGTADEPPSSAADRHEAAPTPASDEPDDEPEEEALRSRGSWHRSRALAARARRTGDAAHARELYEEALRNDPRNPHAVVGLARLAAENGNLEAAVELMERAVALRSRRVTYRVLLGRMLLGAGRPAQALEAFEHAVRLRPSSKPARAGALEAERALRGAP